MVVDVLGFPENKLRVIAVDVGGGFGCKIDTYPETILAALLSRHLARPVKWVEDRQEHFLHEPWMGRSSTWRPPTGTMGP